MELKLFVGPLGPTLKLFWEASKPKVYFRARLAVHLYHQLNSGSCWWKQPSSRQEPQSDFKLVVPSTFLSHRGEVL